MIVASRRETRLFSSLVLVAAVGVLSRVRPIGSPLWDKYLGDVVYAVVFYLGLSLIWRTGSTRAKALATIAYVVTIECFQLTGIPRELIGSNTLAVRLFTYVVLGTQFSWWDLLAYGLGIAGSVLLDTQYVEAKQSWTS